MNNFKSKAVKFLQIAEGSHLFFKGLSICYQQKSSLQKGTFFVRCITLSGGSFIRLHVYLELPY